ncbi:short-chain dehydrogenase/reductase SDR [Parvibaculum lavamentivorans DS-1]|uniref:Short-chain dehydrogenase/reductase SDR n=1 Tax=Parvibaculum lavamentivorans (strain DS-1 / DSM 13023 / NCIMB 13966) TaxID=402881 RepID=A7HTP9_PARL1|nr:SDR family NAD(P)-dependent oxidoreductase [Parvibaculum lavamentivorans]ABS63282.1 short-chain dehydrogenase/reductase SDR [Parvibaculum lavamentivorans DS-1]
MAATAIVAGVGPHKGLGAVLSHRAAGEGLHVFVAGRTLEKLEAVAEAIRAEGGAATAIICDVTDEAQVIDLWNCAEETGPVALAIYNAGNNTPGKISGMTAEYFERSWRVCTYGAFLFAREASDHMAPRGEGTLLFTGASSSMRGKEGFAAFSAAKGGLRTFAQSAAKEFGPLGLHVGHVVIDGGISGEKLHTMVPQYAAQREQEGRLIDLDGIADVYIQLHRQKRSAWSFEVDIRTHAEPW